MLKLQLLFVRVILELIKPPEQIKVEPSIAMVKDLLDDDLDGMLFISVVRLLILLDQMLRYIDLL